MIDERADQVSRLKWPRRFPVPRDVGQAKILHIREGNFLPASDGTTWITTLRSAATFQTVTVRPGSKFSLSISILRIDAAGFANPDQDEGRLDADLSVLLSQAGMWFLSDDDRRHEPDGL